MRTVVKVALGVVAGFVVLFVVAVVVGVIANMENNEKVAKGVANATSQVVIEAPASVTWKGTIGGVEQTGQGTATLDVPNTGSETAKEFNANVRKTTSGDDLMTVILNVDGEERGRESTRAIGSEIRLGVKVSLKK